MKLSLNILIASIALASPLLSAKTHLDIRQPALVSEEVTGLVKSLETDTCRNVSDEHLRNRMEFDESGNALVILNWNSQDELINTTTNRYDENGCLIGQEYKSFGKKGVTNHWKVILSPETRQIAMKNDRTGSLSVRTYSPEKYLLHYRFMDKNKTLKSASRNIWGQDNRRTEYVKYDKKNKPLYTYWFKWKENGFIDKERQSYHQEKKERLHEHEYLAVDDHENWTQQLLVRYDIAGGKKEKVYEKTTVRKIEYFDAKSGNGDETP
ncbi:MAG: hypothetical protein V3V05_04215 [Pontiella sp.]